MAAASAVDPGESMAEEAAGEVAAQLALDEAGQVGAGGVGAGTCGITRSTSLAAVSAIRRPPQDGQNPRPLQEKATSRSWLQPVQWSLA